MKKGEKDIFDDTDFEVDIPLPDDDSSGKTMQFEASSDFEVKEDARRLSEATSAGTASGLQDSSPAAKTTPKNPPAPRFTNSLGMTMVRIEPGEFLMGSSKAQIDKLLKQFPSVKPKSFDAEQPQHPVKITRPFYLAAHQVTVGQFRRFIKGSGYKTKAEKAGDRVNWRKPGFRQWWGYHPVVYVSYNDALAFLGWLNEQEKDQKRSYRLPTEAEWE